MLYAVFCLLVHVCYKTMARFVHVHAARRIPDIRVGKYSARWYAHVSAFAEVLAVNTAKLIIIFAHNFVDAPTMTTTCKLSS